MRLAISGSHGTGKSSLIAAFVDRLPGYVYEPEAYEALADDVPTTFSRGPTLEGLEALLEYTLEAVSGYEPGACVVFERSPVDYLAYAAAGSERESGPAAAFLEAHRPAVRAAVRNLDLIALVPVSTSGPVAPRPGEDERFRTRVDEVLRGALIDDDYDLFGDEGAPVVVELSPLPERQLAALVRHATAEGEG